MQKILIYQFILYLVIFIYFETFVCPVYALTMTNGTFNVQMGNINTTSGKDTGSGYSLRNALGQNFSSLSNNQNYKVRAGFQFIINPISFKFTISSQFIDFGVLSATNPVTRTQTLTLDNGSSRGFTVTAIENHPLTDPLTNIQIPNTTCDNGTCSEINSGVWASNLTYGFGYRCDNISGSACKFITADNYKQFPDLSNSKIPQVIMSGTNVGSGIQSQITYKINIATTQAPGDYVNSISYIATPTF